MCMAALQPGSYCRKKKTEQTGLLRRRTRGEDKSTEKEEEG